MTASERILCPFKGKSPREIVHSTAGRFDEAVAAGERVLAIGDAIGSVAVSVWAGLGLCRIGFAAGAYRRGAEAARGAIAALGEAIDTKPRMDWVLRPGIALPAYLALCLARTGDFDEALREGEGAVALAERDGTRLDRVWADYCLARVHHARTDFGRAIPLLERALALMEEESGPVFLARVLAGLASAYAQSGRAADAGPLLERALAVGESVHLAQGRSLIVVQLGETRLAAGAVDEAAGLAAQALDLARAGGERGNEAWALHLAGEAAAARQPADVAEAQRLFAAAQALAVELDMRPLVARCRVSRGALALAAGDPDDARASLGAALAELTAMGIDGWRSATAGLLARLA